ncbi:hypothetical protein BDZ91DRAFT_730707 [Kalaharituber pfeilii]|nr:hypothetical protein BDZ91DRAFT_730707 [Kalaharituber pfeilii]
MSLVFDSFLPRVQAHAHPSSLVATPTGCSTLTSPSYANLSFSLFILFGILVSYLPQHHRIISRRSSEGISPFFLLLGVTSGTGAFLNILILSKDVLACCKVIGGFNCFAAGLGVGQVGTQWVCFAVILLLFLIYFPRNTEDLALPVSNTSRRWKNPLSNAHPTPATALTVTFICLVHFLVHLIAAFYISSLHPSKLTVYANFLGVQATLLASVQYIPQIYTTWKLQHVGSLSIPMMCIQTPGSFVWAVSLAAREGTAWSSWITYVVTGLLQGFLLVLCISFEVRDRSSKGKGAVADVNGSSYGAADTGEATGSEHADDGDEGEDSPLLRK